MKTEIQASADLALLCKLIENLSVAMMTHLDADGALVSRPMVPLEMDRTGALWFFTELRSTKTEHLRVVNLCFADPARVTYVSLSGRGEIHADHARIKRMWTPFDKLWFPDGPDSTNLALLKFVPDVAEYWDAPHSKMVQMFAMAVSVPARRMATAIDKHVALNALLKPSLSTVPG